MRTQNRQPKGKPAGGQFAPGALPEQPADSIGLLQPTIEPDADDYLNVADDCLVASGLGPLYVTSWDADASTIGFEGSILTDDIRANYLPEDLASKVQSLISDQGGSGQLNFHSWASPSRSVITHLWSTHLDAAESEAVLDRLDADDPDEYNGDLLSHWEAGDPQGLEGEFGFSDTPGVWKRIGKVVAEASPSAGRRLDVAEALCNRVQEQWVDQCDYLGSDDWVSDRAGDAES